MDDRRPSAQEAAVSASLILLEGAIDRAIPFVFVSSVAAESRSPSAYARAKAHVEESVGRYRKGSTIRLGQITGVPERANRIQSLRVLGLGNWGRPYFVPDIRLPLSSAPCIARALVARATGSVVSDGEVVSGWTTLNTMLQAGNKGTIPVPVPSLLLDGLSRLLQKGNPSQATKADAWLAMRYRASQDPHRR